jgi:type I restriction enzyme, S subunit
MKDAGMNADQLIAHYERIADAPDAIARLRRFILDLAVRGKLVEQDPSNEPIAKRYQNELGGENIPASWRALNFGKFCDIEGGNQPPKSQFIDEPREGYVRLFQIRDLGDRPVPVYIPITSARSLCKDGEILIGRYGASVGKVFWAQDGAYNVAMAKFIWPDDALIPDFAFLLLKSEYLQGPLAATTRSAQAGFNKGDLAPINFPLPPLAEQHRIVAKVDELMGLCDRLEAARAEREVTRDRLAAASLARLNAPDPDPEIFQNHAAFALDNLAPLTTRPDQIKPLRQTILNLAVRGKLVEQDPTDESAAELLMRIAAEKARMVKAKASRKAKAISPLEPDDLPFPQPHGWAWTQIAEIGIISPRNEADDDLDASFVPMPMIAAEYGVANKHEPRPWREIKKGYTHFAEGDVGLAKITPCFENGKSTVFRNLTGSIGAGTTELHIVRPLFVDADFIVLFLKSPYFVETGIPRMTGTAGQKRVPTEYFTGSPFPLPPLAEQNRIVAKVDALMALCDRLEAALTTADTTRQRLLEVLLHEALTPGEEQEAAA